jgi:glycosyltransferase involved in cell wall biosynthesis
MRSRPLRILHCPTTVGGNAQGLVRAERRLGLDSLAVAFEQNQFQFTTDEVLFRQDEPLVLREWKRWKFLWRALSRFDIVHFNFGRTIFPTGMPVSASAAGRTSRALASLRLACSRLLLMRDLPLLKAAGKGIVVTYQGDDARQGDFCRAHFAISPASEVEPGYYTTETDAHKRRAIEYMSRYADRMFSVNPDLLHVLPSRAQFIPYASVDLDEWKPVDPRPEPAAPVLLHAPSHRGVKGTRHVMAAVNRLRDEGVPFEFVLVENQPREKARAMYAGADLLLDQLLCGWYGGVAVECMALGKPVVAFMREGDLHFISSDMRRDLPIINATPATVYQVIKEWLTVRRGELLSWGRKGRRYVERWHDPLVIAERLKDEYHAVVESL